MLILLASAAHALSAEAQISALMLQHDPILHFARRLLPPERAAHASALYAWCRRLDEIVDDVEEPGDERRVEATLRALDDWERRFEGIIAGKPFDEVDRALSDTFAANPSLSRAPFDAMVKGMRDDAVSRMRYSSFRPELLEYCYRVAGTVGEMLLPVLGLDPSDDDTVEAAIALGCAVQLINIARDVRSDLLQRDRIYLPREDAKRLGLDDASLERIITQHAADAGNEGERSPPAFRRLVRLQARRASVLLDRAAAAVPSMDRGQALLVAVLIELHHELLDALRECDYDSLRGDRIRVPSSRKIGVACAVAASILLRGPASFWRGRDGRMRVQ